MSSYGETIITRGTQEGEKGLTGLPNIGNNCYLNAVCQCLSNTRPLLEYILRKDYLKEIKDPSRSLLTKRFAEFISNIWEEDSSRRPNTYGLKHAVALYAHRFHGSSQNDAQEFLKYLLQGLHEELNRARQLQKKTYDQSKENDSEKNDSLSANESWTRYLKYDNSIIVDIFSGQLRSVLKCTYCGYSSTIFEPFSELSVPLPMGNSNTNLQQISLAQCLDHFTKEETLDGTNKPVCSKCKVKQTCVKRISIQRFPLVLVIHLKRFTAGDKIEKINSPVDIPVSGLNMAPYAAVSRNVQYLYNLYGVVNHFGGCNFGHYTAYCKHPFSGEWHCFNDSSVSHIRLEAVNSPDSYILFYEAT